jgi:hypothetical protein
MNTSLDRALASTLLGVPMVLISLIADYASDTREKASSMLRNIQLIYNPQFYNVPISMPHGEIIMGIPASWLAEYIRDRIILTCQLCDHICSFEQYMIIQGAYLTQWVCIGCNTTNSR